MPEYDDDDSLPTRECDCCGCDYVPGSYRFSEGYCASCADEHCCCDDCGECISCDDAESLDGDLYCEACYREHSRDSELIADYSDRIDDTPWTKFHPHQIGVELEVECGSSGNRDDQACTVQSLFPNGFVLLKDDGSLDNGFEIVTRPATVQEHCQVWPRFFTNKPRRLRSHDTDSCGLHIHINRAEYYRSYDYQQHRHVKVLRNPGVTDLTAGKMGAFIAAPGNQRFITDVAGRPANTYCVRTVGEKPAQAAKPKGNHYAAMSIRERTIEFRLFRGTLKASTFYMRLEFIVALATHMIDTSARNATSLPLFLRYVYRERDCYPNLYAWLRAYDEAAMVRASEQPRLNPRPLVKKVAAAVAAVAADADIPF